MNEEEEMRNLLDRIVESLNNAGFNVDENGKIEPQYKYKLDLYANMKTENGKVISTGKLIDNV